MTVCRWLEQEGGGALNCWSNTFDDRQCANCLRAIQIGEGSNYDAKNEPST